MSRSLTLISSALCILMSTITAMASSSSPTSTTMLRDQVSTSFITPRPESIPNRILDRRNNQSPNVCGYAAGHNYVACGETKGTLWCAGTVLSDGKGYQYCSTYQVVDQTIDTAAVGNWRGKCPKSTRCWYVFWCHFHAASCISC